MYLGDGDGVSVMSFTSSVHSIGAGGLLQGVGGATSLMLEPSSNGGPSNGPDSLDPNSVLAVLGNLYYKVYTQGLHLISRFLNPLQSLSYYALFSQRK